jgi:hypothetical protein
LSPLIDVITKGLITIAIITLLILVEPKLALIVSFVIGGAYGLLVYFIRGYLFRVGKQNLKNNELRFLYFLSLVCYVKSKIEICLKYYLILDKFFIQYDMS